MKESRKEGVWDVQLATRLTCGMSWDGAEVGFFDLSFKEIFTIFTQFLKRIYDIDKRRGARDSGV